MEINITGLLIWVLLSILSGRSHMYQWANVCQSIANKGKLSTIMVWCHRKHMKSYSDVSHEYEYYWFGITSCNEKA